MKPKYAGRHQASAGRVCQFAYGKPCVRCGRPMLPDQPLDLDHRDDGNGCAGFAHSHCNRSAGAKLGNAMRSVKRKRRRVMLTKCALGIQISEARTHTAIAAAGWVDEEFILVELAAYLEGTDPVADVLRLRRERTVSEDCD